MKIIITEIKSHTIGGTWTVVELYQIGDLYRVQKVRAGETWDTAYFDTQIEAMCEYYKQVSVAYIREFEKSNKTEQS